MTSGSRLTTPCSASPRSCSASSPARAARSDWPGSSARSKAKELVFSGRFVKAAEALEIGLVDRVVPASEVYDTAREAMARFVGGPAYALRAAKEAIDLGVETDLDSGLEIERMLFSGLFATRDRAIGMRHFVEKGRGPAPFEGA